MACPTYFTLAFLQALEEALAKGVEIVEYDNKKLKYRSVDEIIRIRNLIHNTLCPGTGEGQGKFKRLFGKTSKGLC